MIIINQQLLYNISKNDNKNVSKVCCTSINRT